MPDLNISLPAVSPQRAGEYLAETIAVLTHENTGPDAVNIDVPELTFQHPDWNHGDECPECGSTELYHLETTGKILDCSSSKPGMQHIDTLTASECISVTCHNPNCLVDLYRIPSSYLINR